MKRYFFITIFIWLFIICLSLAWNIFDLQREHRRIAFQTARSFFKQVVITREWNALHGGVYVPITENTKPNKYLETTNKNINVNSNLRLTKVNPAFMTRQISNVASKSDGARFHITSLNPIRPKNSLDSLEEEALRLFSKGHEEYGKYIEDVSEYSFFYMAPLKTKKSCLSCHAKQGYKEGDIRGGISLRLPFVTKVSIFPIILSHSVIGAFGLTCIIVFGSRLNRAYQAIQRQAVLDSLTGIPNRLSFSERIFKEFRRCQRENTPLSVLMCDIDYFKEYNDFYGHQNGDECLKKVSQTIKNALKRPDDFCARYGGEEFVIILPNTGKDGALHLAESICQQIQHLNIEHQMSKPFGIVTISIGLATIDNYSKISHEELVSCSDKALYKAKESGRNRIEYFEKCQDLE